MGTIGGPYVNGEYGTESVMNLGVVQVVDDVSDLQSGNLATPPDANVNDVNVPTDRDGMMAIVKSTGNIYQRMGGVWTLIQSAQFQVVDDETDLATATPSNPADGMVCLIRHTGDLFERMGGVWTRIYYAPRYVSGQPAAFSAIGVDVIQFENNTPNNFAYFNLVTLGQFRHAGTLPVTLTAAVSQPIITVANAEPNAKISVAYKLSDNAIPVWDSTLSTAANGYVVISDLERQNDIMLVANLFDSVDIDVLAGCYLHIGIAARNITGAAMSVSNGPGPNDVSLNYTIKATPNLLQ